MAIGRIPEPGTGIPESIIAAKGDVLTGTANDVPAVITVGANETRLVAASGETTGLKYVADTTNYAVAAKGDLLVGTAADTLAPLTVGTDGHTLVADSSTATGLVWKVDPVADLVTTAGDTLYATAADTLVRLGIGTAGQVLQVNSGATAPEWATPAGGGSALTFIASASPSAVSSQSINNCFSATYQNYLIVMNLLNSAAEDPLLWRMRVSGSDASGSDYDYIQEFVYNSDQLIASTNNSTSARATIVNTTVQSGIIINIHRPFDAVPTIFQSNAAWYNGNDAMRKIGIAAVHNVSTSYDGITFLTTGGTMTGTIRVYGYSNS
jgi:hypothetical protein